MKKSFLVLVFTTLFFGIKAQEEIINNQFVLGGSLSFFTQKNAYPISTIGALSTIGGRFSNNTEDSKNTTFSISPYFGKELNSQWLLGLQLGYATRHYTVEDVIIFQPNQPIEPLDYSEKSNQFGVDFFSRYTINPNQRFNFFIQPSIGYNFFNQESEYDSTITRAEKGNFIQIGVGAGILYNINDHLRATLRSSGLTYINGKWEVEDTDISRDFSSFSGRVNLSSFSFGLELRF